MSDGVKSFPLVPNPTKEILTDRQLVDYKHQRERFLDWLKHFGKDPKKAEGYSEYTTKDTMYRTDRFWRWIWDYENKYTLSISHEHADEYMKAIARKDCSNDNKATMYRATKRLYKYRHVEHDEPEWEPDIKFSNTRMGQPQDFLTRQERRDIREAAMEYGSIPKYNDLAPDERDRWRTYLSQRLGKPKSRVKPEDWNRVNSWKIPSIVWTSLDAGFRPVEVKRAKLSWVDLRNERLSIPEEDK